MPAEPEHNDKTALDSEQQLVEATVDGVQDSALTETRRNQICDAALSLFLEKGFDATTIRDICARSGVNQASIYDYIANKNDILRRLLNKLWFAQDVPTLAERLERDPDVPFEDQVAAFFQDVWTKKRQGTLLIYRSIPHLRDETVLNALADQLRERTGLPEDDPRAEVVANMIVFLAAFAPMRDWLNRDIDDTVILKTVAAAVRAMVDQLGEKSN